MTSEVHEIYGFRKKNYMTQCFILYQQSKSHDQTVANYTAPSIDDFTFIDIEIEEALQ